jgi:hypothetical protein
VYLVELELKHYVIARPQDSCFPVFAAFAIQIRSGEEAHHEELGVTLGTALAFMMAVTALSLPEMIILRKVLKVKLLAVFVGIMPVTIIAVGYLFNAIM